MTLMRRTFQLRLVLGSALLCIIYILFLSNSTIIKSSTNDDYYTASTTKTKTTTTTHARTVVPLRNLPRPKRSFLAPSLIQTTFSNDDLSIGKSCQKIHKGWECRDCGNNNSSEVVVVDDWKTDCRLIQPRRICRPIRASNWDPRSESLHDPTDPIEAHRHVLHHYGLNNVVYAQTPCEHLDHCWDMSKCPKNNNNNNNTTATTAAPMKVYGYGADATLQIQNAERRYPESLQWVDTPNDACLLLVTLESPFDTPNQLFSQKSWNTGRNHLLWNVDAYFEKHRDRPFDTTINFDHASLATFTLQDATIRLGYDIATSTMQLTKNEFSVQQLPNLTVLGSRPTLLFFKGNMAGMRDQVWWQHRYLAFEYWELADNIFIDVQCQHYHLFRGRRRKPYTTSRDKYAALMLNTTFAFCPGGGSVGSYRFAEALSLGAIPVVTSEFVPPLSPEIDWSNCILRVSEARIIDIPRILRQIPEDQVIARQRRCRFLFENIIGWTRNDDNSGGWQLDRISRILPLALLTWSQRIQQYYQLKEQGEAMLLLRRAEKLPSTLNASHHQETRKSKNK
jgi:hypothetical protein